MNKDNAKKLLKIALFVYLASFLIINWNDVSWIFNYRVVYGLVDDFFNPYPSIEATSMGKYFYPNHSKEEVIKIDDKVKVEAKEIKTIYTDKQNIIDIPKISISAPIIFSQSTDSASLRKDLDLGVVYYPGSVYPGQIGSVVIIGHSAPAGWPKIKHDWVFSELNKLESGDSIMISLNNKEYKYIVRQKAIIEKGEEAPVDPSFNNKNILTLISCWPPGKNYQRIAVQAELTDNVSNY